MKVYAGAPAAARHYVEADRSRADDYYLAEGSGVARHFTAGDGQVTELAPLTGEAYETWVAGRDPATGEPRGQLRHDERAVRFVEVVVNGPKTWSIAAALHPDIARAYEAAQDRAAGQIIAWLSEHATTRVGPRGGQVPMPVEVLEAATVRHFTSRTRDPHWHLHLQFLSRVFAAGKWRGLFTVDVRDSLAAINGIGHAAMDTDPELNAAFAANGYTKDATGEILELPDYVGPFSARHAQVARNADRYEREWTAAHPGEHPGPALRRSWDTRAWAEGAPGQGHPAVGDERDRTLAHGAAPPRLPAPEQARAPGPHPGRRAEPGRARGAGADPARGRPVGLERGGRARGGGAVDRRRRHRYRAGGTHRAGRGSHRPRSGTLRAAAGPRRHTRAHPGLDLPPGARRGDRPDRPARRPRRGRHT